MNTLRIGLVLDDSLDRNDGVQQYVRTLGKWLAAQGHTVHYLAGETKQADKNIHSLSRNISVRFNGNRLTIPLPANKKAIQTLLRDQAYDVLHIQMPYSPMMAGKVISSAAATTAVVGTFHILPLGRLQQQGSGALGRIQRATLKRFDAVTSVSPPAQDFALSKFGVQSIVIPNSVNLADWQTPLRPHPRRIVFLGRLVPRKGCQQLLAAVTGLPVELSSSVEIIIAGDGPQRQKLESFARRRGLNNVSFIGYIAEDDKASLLASAELAVFPSLGGESFGIVLIEAMAAGAGVVLGGDNPGYRSVLAPQPQALFDPRDAKAFTGCLQKFLTDKKLREILHDKQQQTVKHYDTDIVGKQILELYTAALLHRRQEMR